MVLEADKDDGSGIETVGGVLSPKGKNFFGTLEAFLLDQAGRLTATDLPNLFLLLSDISLRGFSSPPCSCYTLSAEEEKRGFPSSIFTHCYL